MPSITIRDLPESILEKVRILSRRNRRSMNSELIVLIERGLESRTLHSETMKPYVASEIQADMWESLAGEWDDRRSAAEIIEDIYEHRTVGRSVSL